MLKPATLLFSAILVLSCRSDRVSRPDKSFVRTIGVVTFTNGKGCLAIRNPTIAANSEIRIVSMFGERSTLTARVGPEDPGCAQSGAAGPSQHAYEIYFNTRPLASDTPGVGILNYKGEIQRDGAHFVADLDNDRQPEYFSSCASAEGIHFSVWTGKPMTGKLRWHQYYYLGYDVTPTCTPVETTFDKQGSVEEE